MKPISALPRPLPSWDNDLTDAARPDWQTLEARVAFESPWIVVEAHKAIAPTGKACDYGLVHFKNRAIGVVALFDDGTIAMVGQKRYVLGAYSWEIPEGGAPLDEAPEAGGRRELREETGLMARDFQEILTMDLSNSVCDEASVIYLATGLSQAATDMDSTEVIEFARLDFKDVLQAAIRGEVRDAMTVAALLRVHHMAVTGALEASLADKILGGNKY